MEEGIKRQDRSVIDRCEQITKWTLAKGCDEEFGGLFNILDYTGKEPQQCENQKNFGESWDDKVWWAHCEGLYALLLAAVEAKSEELFGKFLDLHQWSQQHFNDPTYGEWYSYLHRDGTPKITDKGSWIKSAFHLPRSLMKILILLDKENATQLD